MKKETYQIITIIVSALLFCLSGCKNSNEKLYTVEFIDKGDTTPFCFYTRALF